MNHGGILTGPEILHQVRTKHIVIDPFDEKRINPGSVDLTLGTNVRLYKGSYEILPYHSVVKDGSTISPPTFNSRVRDSKRSDHWETDSFEIGEEGWVLVPGVCYLMHTAERVMTEHYIPVLDGKSSMGRIFVKVHETAGYGDPGFDGQYTLEVTSQMKVRVYAGMRFCQMRFHVMVGEPLLYQQTGHYTGTAAQGAVGSKIHEQVDT